MCGDAFVGRGSHLICGSQSKRNGGGRFYTRTTKND